MSYILTIEEGASFLHIRVSGENSPETVQLYLGEVYTICSQRGFSSVLIEENLSGPSLSPADIYKIISKASSQTSPILNRIAYVDTNTEHLPSIGALGEAVARDRGANVKVFHEIGEAVNWLMAEKDQFR